MRKLQICKFCLSVISTLLTCGLLQCLIIIPSFAQPVNKRFEIVPRANYLSIEFKHSAVLQAILVKSISEVLESYAGRGGFKTEDIAATLIDLREPGKILRATNASGEKPIYPASVVKMFYLAAIHQQLQDGKIKLTKEMERGVRNMIVDSSNEATQYILDVLTDTSSGPELPQAEFDKWQFKRNRVNRYFMAMGYPNINVNQKTFCEDAYGIEQQSRGYQGLNRNMLTTNATARLLAELALGRVVSTERDLQMMDLMKRDPFAGSSDPDNQNNGFIGKALLDRKMTGSKIWSKAGWTSKSRHDSAFIETPDGLKFVLIGFNTAM